MAQTISRCWVSPDSASLFGQSRWCARAPARLSQRWVWTEFCICSASAIAKLLNLKPLHKTARRPERRSCRFDARRIAPNNAGVLTRVDALLDGATIEPLVSLDVEPVRPAGNRTRIIHQANAAA